MKLDDGIDKEEEKEIKDVANSYARYGSLGIQMVAFLAIGIFGGRWLDRTIGWKFPLFTLLLTFFGMAGAIYFLFKETRRGGR